MKNIKLLWNFMKGHRVLYICAIAAIAVAIFLRNVWPLVLRVTVDSIIGGRPIETVGWLQPYIIRLVDAMGGQSVLAQSLWMCSLILVLLTLSRGLFLFFKGKWAAQASEGIARSIRESLYDHLQHLPFDYHVKAKTGDLVQRCTSDVDTVRRFLAVQLVEIGRALFMVFFALSFMLPMSLKMTLVAMALIPLIFSFALIFFMKVKAAFQASDEAEGRLSTVLQENLTGVRVVRAFARQKFEIDKFDEINTEYRDLTYRLIHLLAGYWSISDFFSLIQISSVLLIGTYWTVTGEISLGTLLAFSSYVGMLLWPIRQLGRVLTDMGKALVSLGRIREILDTPTEDHLPHTPAIHIEGAIVFDNVTFGYEPDKPVLHNVSFEVKAGQTVAILGPTGAGKSTLVHLLPRLYDYTSGSIRIDGKELNSYDRKAIRTQIGIVLQEPFLFSRTLKENIAMAQTSIPDEAIFEASQIAAIHDVIQLFDQGYDTAVGERGVTLSGGQKQRVAIARTILNNSPILIFDDSLSAVDTETDTAIRKALKQRNRNATTFIISHRITTLAEADLILVMEQGKIIEQGTHTELMQNGGLYSRIWSLQNSLEEEFEIDTQAAQKSAETVEKIG
ncbi:MAG: ABC transporter ATP-binding protein [Candidatus Cloacimonetes bacterium]|nr:ABC transporter ATP-binding protein [Candidatus Cloacimonadota bacterium]